MAKINNIIVSAKNTTYSDIFYTCPVGKIAKCKILFIKTKDTQSVSHGSEIRIVNFDIGILSRYITRGTATYTDGGTLKDVGGLDFNPPVFIPEGMLVMQEQDSVSTIHKINGDTWTETEVQRISKVVNNSFYLKEGDLLQLVNASENNSIEIHILIIEEVV